MTNLYKGLMGSPTSIQSLLTMEALSTQIRRLPKAHFLPATGNHYFPEQHRFDFGLIH